MASSSMALLNVVSGSPIFPRNSNSRAASVEMGFKKLGLNIRNDYERMINNSFNCDNEKYQSIALDEHFISWPKPLSSGYNSLSPSDGRKVRVAYQDVQGKEAAQKAYLNCQTLVCNEHEAVFQAVQSCEADRAVIAIENSVRGSIHRNYDLLLRYQQLFIVGQIQLINSRDECDDDDDDVTRFLVLAREPIMPGTDRPYKTSIVFALEDGPGVVFKALAAFALRDITLTKIESRPQKNCPLRLSGDSGTAKYFEYLFYVDFEASMADVGAQHAMAHLREFAKFIRLLGCYPMDTSQSTAT